MGDRRGGVNDVRLTDSWLGLEPLEQRLLLTALPVNWTHLSSATGDIPAPEVNEGQAAAQVLDIDLDGVNDFVIASWNSVKPVVWYKREGEGWSEYLIDGQAQNLEAGGTFYDIDGDGDLDVVFGGAFGDSKIYWWENPYPVYDPGQPWVRREIKSGGGKVHHDMGFADVDGDGVDEFISFNQGTQDLLMFEIPGNPKSSGAWSSTVIYTWEGGKEQEGLAFTDINLDGKEDIVAAGRWFEHTGGTNFVVHEIDVSVEYPRMAVGQLVEGGRPEVVISAGDSAGSLSWYEWNGIGWTKHELSDDVDHGHTVGVGDANGDGKLDILSGEMGKWGVPAGAADNPEAEIRVYYGDGQGDFYSQSVFTGQGIHEGRLADLDGDGDLDIFGKPFLHNTPRLDVWINEGTDLSLDNWLRHEVDGDLPWRATLVDHADINGDGLEDVIAGGWWYRNPGVPEGIWQRNTIGLPFMNVGMAYDFDRDGDMDIFGTQNDAAVWYNNPNFNDKLAWAENDGTGQFTIHENIMSGDEVKAFLQGILIEKFGPNGTGDVEVAVAWELLGGTYSYVVGDDPAVDSWMQRLISPEAIGEEGVEELDSADIDGDGDIDILLGTKWLRNDVSHVDNWWDGDWSYRAPVEVQAGGVGSADKVVEVEVDFTALMGGVGESGALDVNSIRLIEVDGAGQAVDDELAFQFDPGADFDAGSHATGTLVFVVDGVTQASETRHYHLYFDIEGKGFTTANVRPRVSVTDGVIDEGQSSFQIDTLNGSYFYQKQGGGFSSLVDLDGNDWIGHHPTGGSAGSYRGIPNLVYPEGWLHPGAATAVSTLVNSGPVKATIHSVTTDGSWEVVWEIYPSHATMTVLATDHDYWFLYEGTPGGSLDVDQDFVVRSDGTATYASQSWSGDLVGEEWVYFADPEVGRSLYVVNHSDDAATDSYFQLDGQMTVFGFGRSNHQPVMDAVGNEFTIGLMEETVQERAGAIVGDVYQEMSVTVMSAETAGAVPEANAWTPFTIFETEELTDRSRLADINGDGLLDVVVTYSIHNEAGRFAWYEQPGSGPEGAWIEHNIDFIDFPHSLDIADMDGDGDMDIVTGEHKSSNFSSARALVYENVDGEGLQWELHVVYTGDEHHLGTQLFDADNDGDLDIVSIGWFQERVVIYENRAIVADQEQAIAPVISPYGGGYLDSVEVTISSHDVDAEIYYTLDGSAPTWESTLYEGPFTLTDSGVVKAISFVNGLADSDIAQASFTIFNDTTTRVSSGVQVIYDFEEGGGSSVFDRSGIGNALDLTIADLQNVTWGDGVLTIDSPTLINNGGVASKLNDAIMASNELTIEAWISTSDITQNGPARIVSLSHDPTNRNFMIGQGVWYSTSDQIDARLRTTNTDDNGEVPSIHSGPHTFATEMTHVVYTYDKSGLAKLYLDNQVVASMLIGGNMSNWGAEYEFVLGNEATGDRPWVGTFDLVAVYDRALEPVEVARNYYAGSDATHTENEPPVVEAGSDLEVDEGVPFMLTATFIDPDEGDTHTATIDWGDGTVTVATVDELLDTVTAGHLYGSNSQYVVTVTVTDSQGYVANDTLTIEVNHTGAGPGDVNKDDVIDARDIDWLYANLGDPVFDLDGDGDADGDDVDMLVMNILQTYYGDIDLDGGVDLTDLVTLGENYNQAGGWAQGDFDGSQLVDLTDLVTLGENYNNGVAMSLSEQGIGEQAAGIWFDVEDTNELNVANYQPSTINLDLVDDEDELVVLLF